MLFGRNITYRLLDAFVFEQIGPEGIRMRLGDMAVSHQNSKWIHSKLYINVLLWNFILLSWICCTSTTSYLCTST